MLKYIFKIQILKMEFHCSRNFFSELIRKANVNLALFEMEAKQRHFVQLLAGSLKKIQTEAKAANT